jgi:hypothetical protein
MSSASAIAKRKSATEKPALFEASINGRSLRITTPLTPKPFRNCNELRYQHRWIDLTHLRSFLII